MYSKYVWIVVFTLFVAYSSVSGEETGSQADGDADKGNTGNWAKRLYEKSGLILDRLQEIYADKQKQLAEMWIVSIYYPQLKTSTVLVYTEISALRVARAVFKYFIDNNPNGEPGPAAETLIMLLDKAMALIKKEEEGEVEITTTTTTETPTTTMIPESTPEAVAVTSPTTTTTTETSTTTMVPESTRKAVAVTSPTTTTTTETPPTTMVPESTPEDVAVTSPTPDETTRLSFRDVLKNGI